MLRSYKYGVMGRLILGVVLLCPGKVGADVQFGISPHIDTITLGEPLIVSLVVRNGRGVSVGVIHQNSIHCAGYGFGVLRVSEDAPPVSPDPITVIRWFNGAWSHGFGELVKKVEPLTVRPGEEARTELVVLFRHDVGFAFDRPGKYWVSGRVTIIPPKGEQPPYFDVVGEPVTIAVREPEGADRATWEWLKAHKEEYGRLVQIPSMAELPENFVNGCREICANSETVYTEYLALFLSRWYGEGPGKNAAEAVKYAEIAEAKASSETVRKLASAAKSAASKALATMPQGKPPEQPPEQPVEPEVQNEVEAAFQAYIAAAVARDIERALQLQAEDFRGWSRAKQREHLEDEIDEIEELRDQGIPVDVSASILSVVQSGEDVLITALLSYQEGSKQPQDRTNRIRLRKYGDQWLLQDWEHYSPGK